MKKNDDIRTIEEFAIETKKLSPEQRQLTLVFMQGMIAQSELEKAIAV